MASNMQWTQIVDIKKHRSASLNDALFGERYFRYIGFRLKFFFIGLVLLLAIHRLEYTVLSDIFSQGMFITLIAYRGFSVLVLGVWWGVLEVLRDQCRQYYSLNINYQQKITDEVVRWLRLAALISSLIITLYVVVNIFLRTDTLMVLYKAAILVAMVSEILVQTYHAGIYSLKRVYRPLFVLVLTTIFGLVFALLMWPFLGPLSIPVTLAVAAVMRAYASYFFSKRAYATLGIGIPISQIICKKTMIPNINIGILILVGTAGLAIAIDGIIISLLPLLVGELLSRNIVIYIFLILSLISAVNNWPRLFYFDLKRVKDTNLEYFMDDFKKKLGIVGLCQGITLWLFASVIANIQQAFDSFWLTFLMLPFFIEVSLISYFQLKAFCESYYYDVIFSSLLLLIIVLLSLAPIPLMSIYGVTIGLLGATVFIIRKPRFKKVEIESLPQPMGFYSWIYHLCVEQSSVNLCIIKITPTEPWYAKKALMNILATSLAKKGRVALITNSEIACYWSGGWNINEAWLAKNGKGIAYNFLMIEGLANGLEAYEEMLAQDILPKYYSAKNLSRFFHYTDEMMLEYIKNHHIPIDIISSENKINSSNREIKIDKLEAFLFNPHKLWLHHNGTINCLVNKDNVTTIIITGGGKKKALLQKLHHEIMQYNMAKILVLINK